MGPSFDVSMHKFCSLLPLTSASPLTCSDLVSVPRLALPCHLHRSGVHDDSSLHPPPSVAPSPLLSSLRHAQHPESSLPLFVGAIS
ncbi:hypothetical protein DL93DRAFT_2090806, partial [Clavulina sp. PMI_390]